MFIGYLGVSMTKHCNVVLEGGGVKGIAHVGALCALEKHDYVCDRIAGSSAGAIVGALLAAGYDGEEMHTIMQSLDYTKFRQKTQLDHIGSIGKLMQVIFAFGIYKAQYLEQWLHTLLEAKHVTCFKDVKNPDGTYRLQVTTSDISDQELLVLPQDLVKFHIDMDSFPIAEAVRMSMSIPFFYEPYKLKDETGRIHYMVDGGMLSNYPIWILDDGTSIPKHPTFGLKFTSDKQEDCQLPCMEGTNLIDYAKMILSTLLDANDNMHISSSKGDFARSILLSSVITQGNKRKKISTIDFDITKEESNALYNNGYDAAEHFLATWDFSSWIKKYRKPHNISK